MKNKGITLVALVITIILLLILAGITISQLTGSGLFENARLAQEKSQNAQEKEEETLADYENKIGEYIDGTREENYQYQKLRSDNYEEVPFVNGGNFVAPCDGYYCAGFRISGNTSGYLCYVSHYLADGTLISTSSSTSYSYGVGGCELYLKKGEYITMYNQNSTIRTSKFFYAVGCQPEESE